MALSTFGFGLGFRPKVKLPLSAFGRPLMANRTTLCVNFYSIKRSSLLALSVIYVMVCIVSVVFSICVNKVKTVIAVAYYSLIRGLPKAEVLLRPKTETETESR